VSCNHLEDERRFVDEKISFDPGGRFAGAGAAFAQVVVRVAPPPPVVEHRPVSPGTRYVWTDGHHRWNGHRYVRVSGRWAVPPHAGGAWVPGHWAERGGGWVWIEGHWR